MRGRLIEDCPSRLDGIEQVFSKEPKEDQEIWLETISYDMNYIGLTKDMAINRNDRWDTIYVMDLTVKTLGFKSRVSSWQSRKKKEKERLLIWCIWISIAFYEIIWTHGVLC